MVSASETESELFRTKIKTIEKSIYF